MKRTLLPLCLALAVLVPSVLAAEVLVVPHDPARADRPKVDNSIFSKFQTKVDNPNAFLILPFYQVDRASAAGTTTLFAVRNITDVSALVDFAYFDRQGNEIRSETESLDPQETRSINIRDVSGLPSTPGITQGFAVAAISSGPLQPERKGIVIGQLTGDFFQVDVGGAFATGERLLTFADLCQEHEIRFLDFGSGTKLRFFVSNPQGNNIDVDPPSVIMTLLREDGTVIIAVDIFTTEVTFDFLSSVFTSEPFGTMVFDFSNSDGGWVYAEYSADGLFSVGLNSACVVPAPGPL